MQYINLPFFYGCCQGLTTEEADEVIIKILRVRNATNKKGGRKHISLSKRAKEILQKNAVGRSFWRTLRSKHKTLGKKQANKVSVSRGLNCTRDMAVKYIDELAEELIEAKIATEMVKVEPGK